MQKKSVTLAFLILFVFFITIPLQAQNSFHKFNFKLFGGYGIIAGGDMQAMTDGVNDVLADVAALEGFTVTDELENAKWGAEFGGEFVFNLNRKFAMSLGMEYIRKTTDSMAAIEYGSLARLSLEWEPEYTAIPIQLSGYYLIPLGQNIKGYAKAGVGYYFAKIKYTIMNEEELLGVTYYEQQDGEAKDKGFGFHGGLGLEYGVAGNIAVFAEGTGRYVSLNDWDVENRTFSSLGDYNQTGKFWYVEEYNEGTDKFYATMQLSEERPEDPNFRNVRKAKISLSGFVLKFGIKIYF